MTEMTPDEIRSALSARDRWVVLSTLGPDGFPHSVPVGCFLWQDRVIIGCRDGTQKVRNIEREPRVSVLWENGRGEPTLQGVLLRGHARVVREPSELLEFKRQACQLRGEAPPDQPPPPGTVYLEITPSKTVSWNRPSRARQGHTPSRDE